ncbi:MAG: hypothetical protein K8R18_08755 [Parvibaculum sp.]|uniref:hypothetical protein n=1 Tax=Parvibaculum sp. TaxID=2024848 RepID=UPI0025FC0961|nr:hypothetical protein [Parvibaculum sp.]MCE9649697.1 hypothetical protein [Parvibaculum sp.]
MRKTFFAIWLIAAFSLGYADRDGAFANPNAGDGSAVASNNSGQTVGHGWTLRRAKAKYKSDELSRAEYEAIRRDLKRIYREKVSKLKSDYKQGLISKEQYKEKVRDAKYEYEG